MTHIVPLDHSELYLDTDGLSGFPGPLLTNFTSCTHENGSDNPVHNGDYKTYIGAGLAVFAALVSSACLLVIKLSADLENHLPVRRRWRFWIGFLLNTATEAVVTSAALALAPLSVIAPINGISCIFSALLARLGCVPGIREYLPCSEWISLWLCVAAITCCTIFGPSGDDAIPYDQYGKAFLQPAFILFALPAACLVVLWIVVLQYASLRPSRDDNNRSLTTTIFSACGAGACGAFSITFQKIFL